MQRERGTEGARRLWRRVVRCVVGQWAMPGRGSCEVAVQGGCSRCGLKRGGDPDLRRAAAAAAEMRRERMSPGDLVMVIGADGEV